MPPPPRQLWFLRVAGTAGAVMIPLGLWNYSVSGAVRELVAGATILLLVLLARWRWSRSVEGEAEK